MPKATGKCEANLIQAEWPVRAGVLSMHARAIYLARFLLAEDWVSILPVYSFRDWIRLEIESLAIVGRRFHSDCH